MVAETELPQRRRKGFHLLPSGCLLLERPLGSFCVGQALGVIVQAEKALSQLIVSSGERPFVLGNRVLLLGQAPLQRGKLCGKPCGGSVKAFHTGGSQFEVGLGLLFPFCKAPLPAYSDSIWFVTRMLLRVSTCSNECLQ